MTELSPEAVSLEVLNEAQAETAPEAFLSLLQKKLFYDVTFVFDNSPKKIKAHQCFLRARSPVFDAKFRGLGSVTCLRKVKIEGSSPEIFNKFLQFIYADKFDVTTTVEAFHLLQLGHKYNVQPLVKKCEGLTCQGISTENAIEIYEMADEHQLMDLRAKAGDIIARSLEDFLQDPKMMKAKDTTLIALLKRNDLTVKETDLFQLALRWGQNNSSGDHELAATLTEILPHLRFTNMTTQEFMAVVWPTKLIPPEDTGYILAYINGDDSSRNEILPSLKFDTSMRIWIPPKKEVCSPRRQDEQPQSPDPIEPEPDGEEPGTLDITPPSLQPVERLPTRPVTGKFESKIKNPNIPVTEPFEMKWGITVVVPTNIVWVNYLGRIYPAYVHAVGEREMWGYVLVEFFADAKDVPPAWVLKDHIYATKDKATKALSKTPQAVLTKCWWKKLTSLQRAAQMRKTHDINYEATLRQKTDTKFRKHKRIHDEDSSTDESDEELQTEACTHEGDEESTDEAESRVPDDVNAEVDPGALNPEADPVAANVETELSRWHDERNKLGVRRFLDELLEMYYEQQRVAFEDSLERGNTERLDPCNMLFSSVQYLTTLVATLGQLLMDKKSRRTVVKQIGKLSLLAASLAEAHRNNDMLSPFSMQRPTIQGERHACHICRRKRCGGRFRLDTHLKEYHIPSATRFKCDLPQPEHRVTKKSPGPCTFEAVQLSILRSHKIRVHGKVLSPIRKNKNVGLGKRASKETKKVLTAHTRKKKNVQKRIKIVDKHNPDDADDINTDLIKPEYSSEEEEEEQEEDDEEYRTPSPPSRKRGRRTPRGGG